MHHNRLRPQKTRVSHHKSRLSPQPPRSPAKCRLPVSSRLGSSPSVVSHLASFHTAALHASATTRSPNQPVEKDHSTRSKTPHQTTSNQQSKPVGFTSKPKDVKQSSSPSYHHINTTRSHSKKTTISAMPLLSIHPHIAPSLLTQEYTTSLSKRFPLHPRFNPQAASSTQNDVSVKNVPPDQEEENDENDAENDAADEETASHFKLDQALLDEDSVDLERHRATAVTDTATTPESAAAAAASLEPDEAIFSTQPVLLDYLTTDVSNISKTVSTDPITTKHFETIAKRHHNLESANQNSPLILTGSREELLSKDHLIQSMSTSNLVIQHVEPSQKTSAFRVTPSTAPNPTSFKEFHQLFNMHGLQSLDSLTTSTSPQYEAQDSFILPLMQVSGRTFGLLQLQNPTPNTSRFELLGGSTRNRVPSAVSSLITSDMQTYGSLPKMLDYFRRPLASVVLHELMAHARERHPSLAKAPDSYLEKQILKNDPIFLDMGFHIGAESAEDIWVIGSQRRTQHKMVRNRMFTNNHKSLGRIIASGVQPTATTSNTSNSSSNNMLHVLDCGSITPSTPDALFPKLFLSNTVARPNLRRMRPNGKIRSFLTNNAIFTYPKLFAPYMANTELNNIDPMLEIVSMLFSGHSFANSTLAFFQSGLRRRLADMTSETIPLDSGMQSTTHARLARVAPFPSSYYSWVGVTSSLRKVYHSSGRHNPSFTVPTFLDWNFLDSSILAWLTPYFYHQLKPHGPQGLITNCNQNLRPIFHIHPDDIAPAMKPLPHQSVSLHWVPLDELTNPICESSPMQFTEQNSHQIRSLTQHLALSTDTTNPTAQAFHSWSNYLSHLSKIEQNQLKHLGGNHQQFHLSDHFGPLATSSIGMTFPIHPAHYETLTQPAMKTYLSSIFDQNRRDILTNAFTTPDQFLRAYNKYGVNWARDQGLSNSMLFELECCRGKSTPDSVASIWDN